MSDSDKETSVDKVLQILQDLTDKLTLSRIVSALLAGVLAIGLYTAFENRVRVLEKALALVKPVEVDPTLEWSTSTETRTQIQQLIAKGDLVKLVLITQADLKKNRRSAKYFQLEDPDSVLIRKKAAGLLPQAVFDSDERNTKQMVQVLNGEFVCSRYEETVFMTIFPELKPRIPFICRLAVPPFYGRFVGILTFGVSREPTKLEMDSLRIEANRLSVQIYLKDVMRQEPK